MNHLYGRTGKEIGGLLLSPLGPWIYLVADPCVQCGGVRGTSLACASRLSPASIYKASVISLVTGSVYLSQCEGHQACFFDFWGGVRSDHRDFFLCFGADSAGGHRSSSFFRLV